MTSGGSRVAESPSTVLVLYCPGNWIHGPAKGECQVIPVNLRTACVSYTRLLLLPEKTGESREFAISHIFSRISSHSGSPGSLFIPPHYFRMDHATKHTAFRLMSHIMAVSVSLVRSCHMAGSPLCASGNSLGAADVLAQVLG